MAKPRRSTKPPERSSKTDVAPSSRRTIEVRPSWLEDGSDARPTYQRVTMEVDPTWLESESRPPPSAKGANAKASKKALPPPLPRESIEERDEDEPQRSAMPPPLPPAPKKR